jgi:nucleoside-diphosphate-sugar epimerase
LAKQVLVIGGAGFLGSHVARRFVAAGDRVCVVQLWTLIGSGNVVEAVMPPEIAALEPGAAMCSISRLRALVGETRHLDMNEALRRTIAYFRGRLA